MGMNNVKNDDVAKLKLALTHSQPCNGRNCDMCEDSWLHTYRELSVATLLDNGMLPDHLEMEFDVLTDFLTAFHTLKPISDKIYVTNLINRLRESKMGLKVVSPRYVTPGGLPSCSLIYFSSRAPPAHTCAGSRRKAIRVAFRALGSPPFCWERRSAHSLCCAADVSSMRALVAV